MIKDYKKPFLPIIVSLGKRIEKKKLTEPPIFIGGCGRSGTTLLLSILSAHKEILAFPRELNLFNTVPKRIDRLYTYILKLGVPKTAKRWCEKTPRSIRVIDVIDKHYKGNFRFIHIVRDGRDVITSKHPKAENEYWVDPQRWINDVSKGLEFINHPKVLTIKYEDLILNFESTITKICVFLNIPLSNEILNWHEFTTVSKNVAYFTKVQPINPKSIGKWKNSENKKRAEELVNIPKGKKLLKMLNYL